MSTRLICFLSIVLLSLGLASCNKEESTDMQSATESAMEGVADDASEAADAVEEAADDAMDATEEAADDAMDAAEDAMDEAEEMVE